MFSFKKRKEERKRAEQAIRTNTLGRLQVQFAEIDAIKDLDKKLAALRILEAELGREVSKMNDGLEKGVKWKTRPLNWGGNILINGAFVAYAGVEPMAMMFFAVAGPLWGFLAMLTICTKLEKQLTKSVREESREYVSAIQNCKDNILKQLIAINGELRERESRARAEARAQQKFAEAASKKPAPAMAPPAIKPAAPQPPTA